MKKLTYKQAIATLTDLITEGEAFALSGDQMVAGNGRRQAIAAQVQLQIVSAIGEEEFNSVKPDKLTKAESASTDNPVNNVNVETDEDKAWTEAHNPL